MNNMEIGNGGVETIAYIVAEAHKLGYKDLEEYFKNILIQAIDDSNKDVYKKLHPNINCLKK